MNKHLPLVIWLTGLPCSGKTTLAKMLAAHFSTSKTIHIDGDDIRRTLCADLGYSPNDRKENLFRVANLCNFLMEQGHALIVCSFVSPIEADRFMVRNIVRTEHFVEVYVNCATHKCRSRDVKGMWAEADAGHRQGFTGVGSEYQVPSYPEITVDTTFQLVEETFEELLTKLQTIL